jgi:hypothetical protein
MEKTVSEVKKLWDGLTKVELQREFDSLARKGITEIPPRVRHLIAKFSEQETLLGQATSLSRLLMLFRVADPLINKAFILKDITGITLQELNLWWNMFVFGLCFCSSTTRNGRMLQGQHIDLQEVLNKSRGILHNCTPKINELET